MLFVVDVGNTHTVCGVYDRDALIASWRLTSDQDRTRDELAVRYHTLFQMNNLRPEAITGCILASVVPPLETNWLKFTAGYFPALSMPPMSVSHQTEMEITVATENPGEVGADRLVNAVAAWELFKSDLIVIDFGTAITFDCVDAQRRYLGGTIHPGIGISLDALARRTAKLPRVDIESVPERKIGKTTVKAIHSGILHGFGGMVDHMVSLLAEEMVGAGGKIQTIATGGMAPVIEPYAQSIGMVDPLLTLKGLKLIFERNCRYVV